MVKLRAVVVSGTQTLVFLFLYAREKNEGLGDRLHSFCATAHSIPGMTTNVIDELMGVVMGCVEFSCTPTYLESF